MATKEELFSELLEMKNSIQNNNFNADEAENLIKKIESASNATSLFKSDNKSNVIKSFLVTFNINNFSDLTIVFITSSDEIRILEYAGNAALFNEFESLIESEKSFYKDVDSLRVKGEAYKIFHESMENDNGIYTVLTITESSFFKPSKFHILSDIIMDVIRSTDMSRDSIFNDLFEETAIDINSYISANDISGSELYLFKFENIYDFFLKMGLEIIIELSEVIKKKLAEVFGDKSPVYRFSLSEYVVISSGYFVPDTRSSDLNNRNILDFTYKGIVLQHRCIKIPINNKSIYDIIEKIYTINQK